MFLIESQERKSGVLRLKRMGQGGQGEKMVMTGPKSENTAQEVANGINE